MNEIGIYLLIVNALGFYMMWSDKRKAIKDAWRTPERNFFIVALIGGSVGCWAGMQTFRHKTKHFLFWLVNLLGLAGQVALAYFVYTL
jgi:uncharacterized membrane protein YsdA (DUF1294 family)